MSRSVAGKASPGATRCTLTADGPSTRSPPSAWAATSALLRVDPSAREVLLDKAHSKRGPQNNRLTSRGQRHYRVGRSAPVKMKEKGCVDEVGYGSPPSGAPIQTGPKWEPARPSKG